MYEVMSNPAEDGTKAELAGTGRPSSFNGLLIGISFE